MESNWGLVAIYRTRREMNVSCDASLARTKNRVDMTGFGFSSFRLAKGAETQKNGIPMRILTMHPDCPYLAQRDLEEHNAPGHTRQTILGLTEWAKGIAEVRYYNALPLDFYFRTDDRVFIGPYMYGIGSQQTISYEFTAGGAGFEYYAEYFERLWNTIAAPS